MRVVGEVRLAVAGAVLLAGNAPVEFSMQRAKHPSKLNRGVWALWTHLLVDSNWYPRSLRQSGSDRELFPLLANVRCKAARDHTLQTRRAGAKWSRLRVEVGTGGKTTMLIRALFTLQPALGESRRDFPRVPWPERHRVSSHAV